MYKKIIGVLAFVMMMQVTVLGQQHDITTTYDRVHAVTYTTLQPMKVYSRYEQGISLSVVIVRYDDLHYGSTIF